MARGAGAPRCWRRHDRVRAARSPRRPCPASPAPGAAGRGRHPHHRDARPRAPRGSSGPRVPLRALPLAPGGCHRLAGAPARRRSGVLVSERTLVEQPACFMTAPPFDQLPDDVVASVGQRILDTIGICVAACELDTSRTISQFVLNQPGAAQATAVGLAEPVPAAWAALVNGTLAHSLDYDDTHLPSVLHPSATIVPACIAAAEHVGATGRELIAAIAVGLEACVRLGMAGYDEAGRNSTYFDKGQHATSICGAVAGAGAVATLTGLDAAGISNAMAVAASMASGIIESNRTGGNVKRIHCGWAAHAAVCAGQLAALGFT